MVAPLVGLEVNTGRPSTLTWKFLLIPELSPFTVAIKPIDPNHADGGLIVITADSWLES
jgi:hypothetical protein